MPEDDKFFEYALYFVVILTLVLTTKSLMGLMRVIGKKQGMPFLVCY